jgi:hypothetical protein
MHLPLCKAKTGCTGSKLRLFGREKAASICRVSLLMIFSSSVLLVSAIPHQNQWAGYEVMIEARW